MTVIFARKQNSQKNHTMKKVLAILAVAGFMASCNSGENKEKMAADSTRVADSTAKAAMDTARAKMDTTKKKM